MTDESKITAELRVKSCVVGSFPKPPKGRQSLWTGNSQEVLEIKADGEWGAFSYPVSLHFTTDPGHPVIPGIGKIKITIEAI